MIAFVPPVRHRSTLANPAPQQWDTDPNYATMKAVVYNMAVTNDAAERGIKDIQEFGNCSKQGGKLIMVANDHRVRIPYFKKNVMEEEL